MPSASFLARPFLLAPASSSAGVLCFGSRHSSTNSRHRNNSFGPEADFIVAQLPNAPPNRLNNSPMLLTLIRAGGIEIWKVMSSSVSGEIQAQRPFRRGRGDEPLREQLSCDFLARSR